MSIRHATLTDRVLFRRIATQIEAVMRLSKIPVDVGCTILCHTAGRAAYFAGATVPECLAMLQDGYGKAKAMVDEQKRREVAAKHGVTQ